MQCDLLKVPWLWSAESSADLGAKSALVHGRNLLGKFKATSEWERVMVSRSVCDELGSCVSQKYPEAHELPWRAAHRSLLSAELDI
jgi:hypothetical protein